MIGYTKYRRMIWTEMDQGVSVRHVGIYLQCHRDLSVSLLILRSEERVFAYPFEQRYTIQQLWANNIRPWQEGDLV